MKRLALSTLITWLLIAVVPVCAAPTTYVQKVLGLDLTNLLAYWPMNEASGSTANDASGNGRTGTYSGATLDFEPGPDGGPAPRFDGINDYLNVFSASLQSAWNANQGSITAWVRVNTASVWSDGLARRAVYIGLDASNLVTLCRGGTNNMQGTRIAAGTNKVSIGVVGPGTGWVHLAITWDQANDQFKYYQNGVQSGGTQTGIGTFSVTPTTMLVGANNTTGSLVWNGQLAHVAFWKKALSSTEIASLADISVSSVTPTPTPPNAWSDTLSLPGGKTALVSYAMDGGQWLLILIGLMQSGLLVVLLFVRLFETARRSR